MASLIKALSGSLFRNLFPILGNCSLAGGNHPVKSHYKIKIMQNYNVSFLGYLILSVFLLSCGKEIVKNEDIIPLGNRIVSKKEAHLLVNNVAKLSASSIFRELVYKEVSKKFDGDDNSLLNYLNNRYKSIGLKNAFVNSEYESIISTLNERGLYPQIYIPQFEETKLKSIKNDVPIYIIDAFNTDDSDEQFKAYYIDISGEIQETEFLIDEDFAGENEVWVVSLNERVNENGVFIGDNSLNSGRVGTKSEYMMKINCPDLGKIEGWVKGAPELRCIMKSAKGEISDQYFYPSRRKHINNKWWETNGSTGRYLYYWDIESYTKTILFAWIEVDDWGNTSEISGSFTYKDV